MELVALIAGSILLGLFIGMASGMLGIGGGTIMVPAYKIVYGMSAIASTATSMFTIIPTSISGVIMHIRNRTCVPAFGLLCGLGGAVTSPVGVYLASISPDLAIMLVAAVVILYSGYTMFRKAFQAYGANKGETAETTEERSTTEPTSTKQAERQSPEVPKTTFRRGIFCICIGLATGLVSGYVGVGGGFLMVPVMMQFLRLPMKLTSGTSLIGVMILAVPGTISQALLGNVGWIEGCCVAIGSIPGAVVGSYLIRRIPEVWLRFLFGGFLVVAAVLLVLDTLEII